MNRRAKGRKGRNTEHVDEEAFARLLDSMGIWSQHVESHYGGGGWPDRYLGQGTWIEFKSFIFREKQYRGRPPALHKLLRRSQKRMVPRLLAAGDTVYVCVVVHNEDLPRRFFLVSYTQYLDLSEKDVERLAQPWNMALTETQQYVKRALSR